MHGEFRCDTSRPPSGGAADNHCSLIPRETSARLYSRLFSAHCGALGWRSDDFGV